MLDGRSESSGVCSESSGNPCAGVDGRSESSGGFSESSGNPCAGVDGRSESSGKPYVSVPSRRESLGVCSFNMSFFKIFIL